MTEQDPQGRILIKCPYCRSEMKADASKARRGIPCVSCGRLLSLHDSTTAAPDRNTDESKRAAGTSDPPIYFQPSRSPGTAILYIAITLIVIIAGVFGASRLGLIALSVSTGQPDSGSTPLATQPQNQPASQPDVLNEMFGRNTGANQTGDAGFPGQDEITENPDTPEVKNLLDFIMESDTYSRQEDESFLSLDTGFTGTGTSFDFNPLVEIELDAGETIRLPDDKAVMVLVLGISMSPEWIVLDVQESSIDFRGPWHPWRETLSSSYLVAGDGILMIPALEQCTGWTDGSASAGDGRGGTIAFPNNLSTSVNSMTLYYAYNPPLGDDGRSPIPFNIDPMLVITNPAFSETEAAGTSGNSRDDAIDYIHSGFDLLNREDFQDAVGQFSSAINIDPSLLDAYNGRGIARNLLGENQDAISDFNVVLHADPGNLTVRIYRARVYIELGEYDEALSDLNQVLLTDPFLASAYYYRALIYSAQGDDEKAIEELTLAIENDPQNSTYYFSRALAYDRIGDHEASEEDLRVVELLSSE